MATLFTSIINGDIPGRFMWRDDRAVVFLTIAPIRPGHALVVPIEEVDHWIDLDPDEWRHLTEVARQLGAALERAFSPTKVGMMLAGLEVPHTHIHLVPIDGVNDLDFDNAERDPDEAALDDAAERIRNAVAALR
jgi:histidine triad (HIT) family protein